MDSFQIKPNAMVFVYYNSIKTVIGTILLTLVGGTAYVVGNFVFDLEIPIEALIIGAVLLIVWFFLGGVFPLVSRRIAYGKELYRFEKDEIIFTFGGLFNESERELKIKNITKLRLVMPWFEHMIFKTGYICIQTAGTSSAEIPLRCINNPEKVFDMIQQIMAEQGFSMKKDTIIQQEMPSKIGSLIEAGLYSAITGSIFSVLIVTAILSGLTGNPFLGFLIAVPFVFVVVGVPFAIHYLNYYKRTYILYSSMIRYKQGFLTKGEMIIPHENITNTNITQKFYEKLLGIYDVTVSCKGASNEVIFRNMPNAELFKANLEESLGCLRKFQEIVEKVSEEEVSMQPSNQAETLIEQQETSKPKTSSIKKSKAIINKIVHSADDYQTTTNPNLFVSFLKTFSGITIGLFAIVSLVLIASLLDTTGEFTLAEAAGGVVVIIVIVGFITISGVIRHIRNLLFTKYVVTNTEIQKNYSFFSSSSNSYRISNVTCVSIRRSFIDRIFNTCTIYFSSAGSSEKITFDTVKASSINIDKILAKTGVDVNEQLLQTLKPRFSIFDFVYKGFILHIFSIMFFMGFLIASVFVNPLILILAMLTVVSKVLSFIFEKLSYSRAEIQFFEHFVHMKKGFAIRYSYYFLYDHIKDVSAQKYPVTNKGTINFNLVGDVILPTEADSENNQQMSAIASYCMEYLDNALGTLDIIDKVYLDENVSANADRISEIQSESPKIVHKQTPSTVQGLVNLTISTIILFPFIPTLIFTLPIAYFVIKQRRYILEEDRIVYESGIIYKSRFSIRYDKVDHIDKNQGFTDKFFSTGSVHIYTVGSSCVELSITNIANHNNFYSLLEEKYKSK